MSISMQQRPTLYPFCRALPKVELHAHLNGSLSPKTLRLLGCDCNLIVRYMKLISILFKSATPLDECFELFQIAHNVTKTPRSVFLATKGVIEDFAYDNVMYLELRTTPRSEEGMTKEQYIEALIKAIKENKKDITVKVILSINRSHDIKDSQDSMNTIIKMKKTYPDIIKGVDLSGNPKVGRFESELFKIAKENGLFTTIHCAEVKNDEEVKEILNFHPDRIGHATFLHPKYGGCEENWKLYCEKRIPVECCITSNVLCETTPSHMQHHIREWIDHKLPFSISTDDKGVFVTCLAREYQYTMDYYGLTKEDLWKVSLNAIDYSFASYAEKLHLKTKLAEWKRDNDDKWFK